MGIGARDSSCTNDRIYRVIYSDAIECNRIWKYSRGADARNLFLGAESSGTIGGKMITLPRAQQRSPTGLWQVSLFHSSYVGTQEIHVVETLEEAFDIRDALFQRIYEAEAHHYLHIAGIDTHERTPFNPFRVIVFVDQNRDRIGQIFSIKVEPVEQIVDFASIEG